MSTASQTFGAIASEQANLGTAVARLPGALHATTTALGKVQTFAEVLHPTAVRARAGRRLADRGQPRARAVPARGDADRAHADPSVRPRRPAGRARADPGRPGARRGGARPDGVVHGAQPPVQHARLQPVRRVGVRRLEGRDLPLLAGLARPQRERRLLERRRQRPVPGPDPDDDVHDAEGARDPAAAPALPRQPGRRPVQPGPVRS